MVRKKWSRERVSSFFKRLKLSCAALIRIVTLILFHANPFSSLSRRRAVVKMNSMQRDAILVLYAILKPVISKSNYSILA